MSRILAPVLRNGFPFGFAKITNWDGVSFCRNPFDDFEGVLVPTQTEGACTETDNGRLLPVYGGGLPYVALTQDQFVKLYWRIKSFTYYITLTYNTVSDSLPHLPIIVTSSDSKVLNRVSDADPFPDLSQETALFRGFCGFSAEGIDGYAGSPEMGNGYSDLPYPFCQKEGDPLTHYVPFGHGSFNLSNVIAFRAYTPPYMPPPDEAIPGTPSVVTCTIYFTPDMSDAGISVPMYDNAGQPGGIDFISGALKVYPKEFFAYDGQWDPATGAFVP